MAADTNIDCTKYAASTAQQAIGNDYQFLVSALVDTAWPLLILILVFFLRRQIKGLLIAVEQYFGKVAKLQIGGVSITVDQFKKEELENAIVEFEILKSMIATASADGKIDKPETEILFDFVNSPQRLEGYLDFVSDKGKQRIFSESLIIAGADKKIDEEEYEFFLRKGNGLGVALSEINMCIRDFCTTHKVKLPPQLTEE